MPAVETRVVTGSAQRYLTQLCRHAEAVTHRTGMHAHGGASAGPVLRLQRVDAAGADATLHFEGGRCTVHADPGALSVHIDAADTASLERIRDQLTADLHRFGARERLRLTWRDGVQ